MSIFASVKADLELAKETEYRDGRTPLELRRQWLSLMDMFTSVNDRYRMYKKFFQQKDYNSNYIRLPINTHCQANLQRCKALQRLLKEDYVKLIRVPKPYCESLGYKSSDSRKKVKQSYLQLNGDKNV